MACALDGRGRFVVACRTAASGAALMGLARRNFFDLSNVTGPATAISGGVMAVGTSFCAPVSGMSVPANRVTGMRNAPVSFHAPREMSDEVGSPFRRLRFNTNCSRYCMLGGHRTNALDFTTGYIRPRDNHDVRMCAARPNMRICASG